MEFAFLAVAVVWGCLTVLGLVGHLSLRRLPAGGTPSESLVSVIVPARDEAERIRGTVEGLLRQSGVQVEILIVDDGSTDATPEVLREFSGVSGLRVIRLEEVPRGWLGKCHACHVGAAAAQGDWLLFVDADTWCREDAVARAVATAEAEGADHLCVLPDLGRCTLGGQATVLMTMFGMLGLAAGVNRDLPLGYVGVGAFTLVRRNAYERIGGHEAVKMQVIEDFAIGHRLRRHGFRSRIFLAFGDVEVRWAHSVRSFIAVLEKNMFAKTGYRTVRLGVQLVLMFVLWALPLVGWFVGGTPGQVAGWSMAAATIPAGIMTWRCGFHPLAALLAPLTLPLLGVAAVHSARRVLAAGGVRWRGVHYPLAELRAAAAEEPKILASS